MTALLKYQRLEAAGVWRPAPRARLRDVVVTVGDATLVLMDPRSETPLAHWSLPAVTRLNPGQNPAIYGPSRIEADEVLEIDDPLMIAAIEKLQTAIDARRPHPGRLRGLLLGMALMGVVILGLLWFPGAAIRHATAVAAPAQREAIGRQVLARLESVTGPSCRRAAGATVLDRMATRLGLEASRVVVLPATLKTGRGLPGQMVVLGDDLLAAQSGPDIAAGHVLAAQARAETSDPLQDVLEYVGARAALTLLLRGDLPDRALEGYGERMLAAWPQRAPLDSALIERFNQAGIPPRPFLMSSDPQQRDSASWAALAAAPTRPSPKPILSPGEWSQLQHICDP